MNICVEFIASKVSNLCARTYSLAFLTCSFTCWKSDFVFTCRSRYSPRARYSPRRRSPPLSYRPKRRPWSPPPNRNTGLGKPGRNLFIAGFSFGTTERDLEKKFSRYGHVRDVRIVRDRRFVLIANSSSFIQEKEDWPKNELSLCV